MLCELGIVGVDGKQTCRQRVCLRKPSFRPRSAIHSSKRLQRKRKHRRVATASRRLPSTNSASQSACINNKGPKRSILPNVVPQSRTPQLSAKNEFNEQFEQRRQKILEEIDSESYERDMLSKNFEQHSIRLQAELLHDEKISHDRLNINNAHLSKIDMFRWIQMHKSRPKQSRSLNQKRSLFAKFRLRDTNGDILSVRNKCIHQCIKILFEALLHLNESAVLISLQDFRDTLTLMRTPKALLNRIMKQVALKHPAGTMCQTAEFELIRDVCFVLDITCVLLMLDSQ